MGVGFKFGVRRLIVSDRWALESSRCGSETGQRAFAKELAKCSEVQLRFLEMQKSSKACSERLRCKMKTTAPGASLTHTRIVCCLDTRIDTV